MNQILVCTSSFFSFFLIQSEEKIAFSVLTNTFTFFFPANFWWDSFNICMTIGSLTSTCPYQFLCLLTLFQGDCGPI